MKRAVLFLVIMVLPVASYPMEEKYALKEAIASKDDRRIMDVILELKDLDSVKNEDGSGVDLNPACMVARAGLFHLVPRIFELGADHRLTVTYPDFCEHAEEDGNLNTRQLIDYIAFLLIKLEEKFDQEYYNYLISMGASIDHMGWCFLAATLEDPRGKSHLFSWLIEHGADFNTTGYTTTPLSAIVGRKQVDPGLVKYLMSIGLDPSVRDDSGKDSFDYVRSSEIEKVLLGLD